uniref:Uncharacterized protein n=1 Tax=Glossina morsitans morsitans TaxID=37546 RepID=A0A1B0FES0_GLOMM
MSDYFHELGLTPTGPEGADDFDRNIKRLQVLAIMNGIDIEIEVPEASKRAIAALPTHEIDDEDDLDELECAVCKQPARKKANSCPMCRYELETDDEAYEELRRFRQDEANRRERNRDLMNSMFL